MASDKFPPFTFTNVFHNTVYPAIDPTNPKLSAKDKVILVTGGGRGLGKAIASSFAIAGARAIVLLGRTASTLASSAADISARHKNVTVRTFPVDITDGSAVTSAVTAVRKEIGPIDVFISNAGDFHYGSIAESNLAEYWKSIEINMLGTLNCVQAFLNHGIASDVFSGGQAPTFINLSTVGSHLPPYPGMSAYSISKLATLKMMQCLQVEQGNKLRVFSIHPGTVATDMARKAGVPSADEPGTYFDADDT